MLLYFVLCLAAAFASGLEEPPLPKWPQVYTVKMDFYLPGIDYKESVTFWYDGKQNKSRIDDHTSTWQAYTEANKTDLTNSEFITILPITTEKHLNERTCFIDYDCYEDYNVLPQIYDELYVYIGNEKVRGEDALKYRQLTQNDNEIIEEKTMWVTLKEGAYAPLKSERKVHDTKHGTLLRHTSTDYYDFDTSEIDPKIWDIGHGMDCQKDQDSLSTPKGLLADKLPLQDHKKFHPIHNEFARFKIQFNKMYQSKDEHNKRLKIFEDNVRMINEHNKAGHSYKMKVNHLSDRTEEELAMMLGTLPRSGPSKALPFPYTAEEIERLSKRLPKEFDWRAYGAVTPVKDQGMCGSCWAFGTVGAVEGALFLRNGKEQVVRLSEQALVDCSFGFDNYGCGGGWPHTALEYIKVHGLPNDDAYGGYIRSSGLCHIENLEKAVTVKDYYNITEGSEEALKVALFKHGPVVVAVAVNGNFVHYSHGVFYDPDCKNGMDYLNHAVLVVGYGVLDGEKYWIIKNSWGVGWGDNGYILMSTKNNTCGVETFAIYAEVE